MITSSNTMALNNHCATALGPRLGLGLRLDFGSQVWFVQYFSENLVVVSPAFRGQASQVKSRFTLLGGKKAICRGSGPDWRAGAGARVWSPLPPGRSKESGER